MTVVSRRYTLLVSTWTINPMSVRWFWWLLSSIPGLSEVPILLLYDCMHTPMSHKTSPQIFAAQYSSSILRTSTMTNTNGDAIRTCIPPQSGTVISDSRSPRRIRQDHFWITDLAWRASISLEWFSKLVAWKENLYLLKVQEIIEEIELCYGRYTFSWKTRKGWRNSVTRWFTDDGWMNTSRRPSDQCGRFPEARPARRPNALACPARTLSSSIAPTFG